MITLHIPKRFNEIEYLRNLLYYQNTVLGISYNKKDMRRIIDEKMPIRKAIGKLEGIPIRQLKFCKLNDLRRYGLLKVSK